MTEEILEITDKIVIDDTVESFQYIENDTDQGTRSLNNQTELTVTFRNQDGWYRPSQSYLRIEGTLLADADANITNNSAIAFVLMV